MSQICDTLLTWIRHSAHCVSPSGGGAAHDVPQPGWVPLQGRLPVRGGARPRGPPGMPPDLVQPFDPVARPPRGGAEWHLGHNRHRSESFLFATYFFGPYGLIPKFRHNFVGMLTPYDGMSIADPSHADTSPLYVRKYFTYFPPAIIAPTLHKRLDIFHALSILGGIFSGGLANWGGRMGRHGVWGGLIPSPGELAHCSSPGHRRILVRDQEGVYVVHFTTPTGRRVVPPMRWAGVLVETTPLIPPPPGPPRPFYTALHHDPANPLHEFLAATAPDFLVLDRKQRIGSSVVCLPLSDIIFSGGNP